MWHADDSAGRFQNPQPVRRDHDHIRRRNPKGRAAVVHRLDRDTSGLLLLAKKRTALTNLHEQMRDGLTDKRYLVLVAGDWKNARQHIKLPLHKYTTAEGERRVAVQADGLASHTVFSLLHKYHNFALLEAELKTGRTHQIRVHLSSSGFPIAGDDKYGDFALNRCPVESRQHARRPEAHVPARAPDHVYASGDGQDGDPECAAGCRMRAFLGKLGQTIGRCRTIALHRVRATLLTR